MKRTLLFIVCFVSGIVYGETPEEIVQTKLNNIHSMTANFQQVVKAKSRVVSRSSGSMALLRPGRFRWQTKDPMEQLVVADGKKMWIYDNALEQVTVKNQEKGMGGTAALFLSGYGDTVARDFAVSQSKQGANDVFDMKSKSHKANIQRIKLIFTKNSLTGLELFDQLGQVTTVKLLAIKDNPSLGDSLFHFKPPKGVDVVQQ